MLAAGAAAVSNAGARLLAGTASRLGTLAAIAGDAALLKGVIDESRAVLNGQCQ